MSKDYCETCRHYRPYSDDSHEGTCLRFPPAWTPPYVVDGYTQGGEWEQPQVCLSDRCGEHRPIEEKEAAE